MKRVISVILVLVLILTLPISAFASSNGVTYSTQVSFDKIQVNIQYSIIDNIIYETNEWYESEKLQFILTKRVSPDGSVIVYKDGVFIHSGTTDYDTFLAAANGNLRFIDASNISEAIIPREVYYPCGRTESHTLVETNSETINVRVYNAVSDLAAFLIAIKLGAAGAYYEAAYNFSRKIFELDADYVDVTEWKYFLYNYDTGVTMNCYHAYYKAYNINSIGETETVDAWNYYHQEIL